MLALRSVSAFVTKSQVRASSARAFRPTLAATAQKGQAEVVLVGCGAPNRGMGWVRYVVKRTKENAQDLKNLRHLQKSSLLLVLLRCS
jgi:hypothetical protein